MSLNDKASRVISLTKSLQNGARHQASIYIPLRELGLPSSLSILVRNLLECGWDYFCHDDSYPSLNAASADLHLLVQDPKRFLFDKLDNAEGALSLQIKRDKLYGREIEVSLITDAICRASSSRKSEALFIGGFSGSGKSRLVNFVKEQADVAGAYIISQKFEQISKAKPLSVVISAFNDLCLLIKHSNSDKDIHSIMTDLMSVFGTHLSTLARVIPSITALLPPQFNHQESYEHRNDHEINFCSACYILKLFMRVVSNQSRPVILCLDDLQWSDGESLDVISTILTDINMSSFLFFVGR